jgi:CubicO group peptidase (beta-lactamase class C family)
VHQPVRCGGDGARSGALLSHESVADGRPSGSDWSTTGTRVARANLAACRTIGPAIPPNTQQKYSNLAYQLLGEIVARVSGVPYVAYVRRADPRSARDGCHVVRPAPRGPRGAAAAVGYRGPMDVRRAPTPRTVGDGRLREGGLWSCVDDLARWVGVQFLRGRAGRTAGADPRRVDPRGDAPSALSRRRGVDRGMVHLLVRRAEGRRDWVQHSGGLPGSSRTSASTAGKPASVRSRC